MSEHRGVIISIEFDAIGVNLVHTYSILRKAENRMGMR